MPASSWVLPVSLMIVCDIRSRFSSIHCRAFRKTFARSLNPAAHQAGCAARALATSSATCAASSRSIEPTTAPVAGLVTSMVSVAAGGASPFVLDLSAVKRPIGDEDTLSAKSESGKPHRGTLDSGEAQAVVEGCGRWVEGSRVGGRGVDDAHLFVADSPGTHSRFLRFASGSGC